MDTNELFNFGMALMKAQMSESNYPENVRDYDHNPGSPFYEEAKDDELEAHWDNEWSED